MSSYYADLAELFRPYIDAYTVVDVGAHSTGESNVYERALLADGALVIGFEPNERECNLLNARGEGRRLFYPHAIGDGAPGTFHVCQTPLTSSLLRPNDVLLREYENLAEMCEVVELVPIETVRLDDISDIAFADFLKVDIQGATLPALSNAENLLDRTLVVHAEVEFVPIYSNQSLFSECEIFMRNRGFMFHHFHHVEGRRMKHESYAVGRSPSQTLWADAVFVPSLQRLDGLTNRDLIRLAWTMDAVYDAADIAMSCLHRCNDVGVGDIASRYQQLLAAYGRLS